MFKITLKCLLSNSKRFKSQRKSVFVFIFCLVLFQICIFPSNAGFLINNSSNLSKSPQELGINFVLTKFFNIFVLKYSFLLLFLINFFKFSLTNFFIFFFCITGVPECKDELDCVVGGYCRRDRENKGRCFCSASCPLSIDKFLEPEN